MYNKRVKFRWSETPVSRMSYSDIRVFNFILQERDSSLLPEYVMDCISDPGNWILEPLWDRR